MILKLFELHVRSYNGYMMDILNLEIGNWESSLFGINFCKDFLYLNFLFLPPIKIFDKTEKLEL